MRCPSISEIAEAIQDGSRDEISELLKGQFDISKSKPVRCCVKCVKTEKPQYYITRRVVSRPKIKRLLMMRMYFGHPML